MYYVARYVLLLSFLPFCLFEYLLFPSFLPPSFLPDFMFDKRFLTRIYAAESHQIVFIRENYFRIGVVCTTTQSSIHVLVEEPDWKLSRHFIHVIDTTLFHEILVVQLLLFVRNQKLLFFHTCYASGTCKIA